MDPITLNDRKSALGRFRAGHKAKKDGIDAENRKAGGALKKFWADGARSGAVLAHNGIVFLAWACAMAVVAYASLQLAFVIIAMVLAETGGILMETSIDVITAYVVIAMCCGFDMFFSFAVEKWLMKHMARRFWRIDRRTGAIDKGDAWRERHAADCGDGPEQE